MSEQQIFNYGTDHLTAKLALAISNGEIKGILSQNTRNKVLESSKAVSYTHLTLPTKA